jgi:AcrR family transcriptional regulator
LIGIISNVYAAPNLRLPTGAALSIILAFQPKNTLFIQKIQTNLSDWLNFAAMITAENLSVRDQIVKTACRLFYNQGYHLTGINQIIEEAGVAKASLYYHFPSKEDLCVEYLKKRYEIWSARLAAFLAGETDPKACILKTFECRSAYLSDTNYGGCSYIRIISEMPQRTEKINRQVILQKEKQRQLFVDQVKKIKEVTHSSINDLANTIFLLFDGATVQCQVYQALWPIDNALKALKGLL